ncbi:MAG: hypothetical protein IPO21_17090 [Bacteroidales bacterium]|nr:hypothetical protein [Bacteroidales bacterium]
MWIGTTDGLFKFDGFTITPFTDFKTHSGKLVSNSVKKIILLGNDTIVLALKNEICIFNTKNENYRIHTVSTGKVNDIEKDKDLNIWIASETGLYKIENQTKKVTSLFDSLSGNIKFKKVNVVCPDLEGDIWFSSEKNKIHSFSKNKITEHKFPESVFKDKEITANCIFTDQYNRKFIGTDKGLILSYNSYRNQWNEIAFSEPDTVSVSSILQTKSGKVMVITNAHGVFEIAENRIVSSNYVENENDKYKITCIYQSVDNVMWFGTKYSGILKRCEENNLFKRVDFPDILNSENESALNLTPINDGVAFAVNDKLYFLKNNEIQESKSKQKFSKIATITSNFLNEIIITTPFEGIYTLTDRAFVLSDISKKVINDSVEMLSVFNDTKDNIWLLTKQNGLYKYSKRKDKITDYNTKTDRLLFDKPTILYEDSKATLWAAIKNKGLHVYNPLFDKFTQFVPADKQYDELLTTDITDMFEDSKGKLWICTDYSGVFVLYNKREKLFKQITTKTGFPTNTVRAVLEDKNGDIWFSTPNGIIKYYFENDSSIHYNFGSVISNTTFQRASKATLADGNILFGSSTGIVYFHPDSFSNTTYRANVQITGLKIYSNENKIIKNYLSDDSYIVPDNFNYFAISFASLDYRFPKATKYRYMLEDVDSDWITCDADNRIAIYSNLKSGTYTFIVNGTNANGIWSEHEAKITIRVKTPLYRSFAALIIYAIILLVIILLAIRYLRRYIKNREIHSNSQTEQRILFLEQRNVEFQEKIEQLEKSNKTKDNFISIIAQDLRTPLSVLIGFTESLDMRTGNLKAERIEKIFDAINSSTKIMYDLLVNLLDWAQIQAGTVYLNIQRLNLNSIVVESIEGIQKESETRRIEIKINVEPTISVQADLRMLQRIFKNVINHSLKFSKDSGTIVVDAKYSSDEFVEISIIDNGLGLTTEQMENIFKIERYKSLLGAEKEGGMGLGLIVSKEFVELHGGIFSVVSELGKGTTLKFYLPK